MDELFTFEGIRVFDGEYSWLSNFHGGAVVVGGVSFPTAEHAYQALKAVHQGDFDAIRNAATPGKAKRMGRVVEMHSNWNDIRVGVMRMVVEAKFTNPYLAKKLIATAPRHLEEGNTWGDVFWGVCGGKGSNVLGVILMETRDKLIAAGM